MDIKYKNKKLKKVCTDAHEAQKVYGAAMADKIHQRIDQIIAADSVEFMTRFQIGNCHPLKFNRKDQYAVDLVQPFRLVFTAERDLVQIAVILEIVDYH